MWFYGRFVEIFSLALVELGANQKWPVGQREWQEVAERSDNLTPDVLWP